MSQHDFDKLLQKYLAGQCSKQEEAIVLEWYDHLIKESVLDISDDEKAKIQAKIWANLSAGMSAEQPRVKQVSRSKYRSIFYRAAIAASIIVAVTAWYWWPGQFVSKPKLSNNPQVPDTDVFFTNNSESEKKLTLDDGSTVKLEPHASLQYPRLFTGSLREVYLTGNAFFKVSPNAAKHFLVHTGELVTEVLGTSFYIHQNQPDRKLEIAVVSGKVSVYEQDKRIKNVSESQPSSVILTPNQKVTYNAVNSQFITSLVEEPELLEQNGNSETGNFVFDDVPLSKVLEELKKAYGIEIYTENKDVENCHFSGDITRQDLYKKLEIICLSSPSSSYEVRGTTIIIKGRGCGN